MNPVAAAAVQEQIDSLRTTADWLKQRHAALLAEAEDAKRREKDARDKIAELEEAIAP